MYARCIETLRGDRLMTTERILTAAGLAAGLTLGLAACGEGGSTSASSGSTGSDSGSSSSGASADSASSGPSASTPAEESIDDTAVAAAPAPEARAGTDIEEAETMASNTAPSPEAGGTLAATLGERKAQFRTQAPEELATLFERGVQEVADSGILANAVNEGDTAPEFVLPDAVGRSFSLREQLEEGPVVLVWYRGGWCPYCNLTLAAYQERLDEIEAAGATLVAISPEVPDKSLDTKQKNELSFPVLSDVNNAVAKRYGVVFELNAEVAAKYKELGLDLEAYNANSSDELPLAATYVINTDGTVTYAFLDADYTKRAEPDEVIAALREIQG